MRGTKDEKMGVRKREDTPTSDNSSGSEKSRKVRHIRWECKLAYEKRKIREFDYVPLSGDSYSSQRSKQERDYNGCDRERKKRKTTEVRKRVRAGHLTTVVRTMVNERVATRKTSARR